MQQNDIAISGSAIERKPRNDRATQKSKEPPMGDRFFLNSTHRRAIKRSLTKIRINR